MPFVRLLEPGFENFTGVLHEIAITNGRTTEITQADAEKLAVFGRVELTNAAGNQSLGPVVETSFALDVPKLLKVAGQGLSVAELELEVDETSAAIEYREIYTDATHTVVPFTRWTIDDTDVATITKAAGKVTVKGVAAGTTTLRADDLTIEVTVVEAEEGGA